MNPDIVTIGTLKHSGSSNTWNQFDFYPAVGGDPMRMEGVMAITIGRAHSFGGFALLGMITAFPAMEFKLTLLEGGAGAAKLECSPDHSLEDVKRPPPKQSGSAGEWEEHEWEEYGKYENGELGLPYDSMPVYMFQVFVYFPPGEAPKKSD
jgi:hypothetical protein